MGVVARQTIKASVFIYLGTLFGMANRLYFFPKFMTPEQIGFVSVFTTMALLMSYIGLLGMGNTFNKYFDYFKAKGLMGTFNFLFVSVGIFGALLLSVALLLFRRQAVDLFSKDSPLLYDYLYYVIPFGFALIFSNIFTSMSRSHLRLTVPSLYNELAVRLLTGVGIVMYGLQVVDFTGFVLFYIGIFVFVDIGIWSYISRTFNIRFDTYLSRITRAEYKELANYGFYVFVGGFSSNVVQYADTLMLSSMLGFDAVGIYSIAFFMAAMIEIPRRTLVSMSMPIVSKLWLENNMVEMEKLYKQSSINQGIIGLLLLLLLWVNIDEVYFFIPDSEIYRASKYVVLFVGLARVVDMFMGINSEILRISKHYRLDFLITVSFIGITVLSNYLLIPLLGLNGAGVATLISVFLYNIVRYVVLKRLYHISPFNGKSWILLLLFAAFFAVHLLLDAVLPTWDTFAAVLASLALKTLFYGGASVLLVYFLKLSDEMNSVVNGFLLRVGVKKG